jgi:hypothetical protein
MLLEPERMKTTFMQPFCHEEKQSFLRTDLYPRVGYKIGKGNKVNPGANFRVCGSIHAGSHTFSGNMVTCAIKCASFFPSHLLQATAILRSSSLEHPHYFSSTAQALNILYDQDSALSKVITDHSGHWPLFLPLGCQELTTRATVTTGLLGSHVTFSQNPSQSLTQFLVRRWSQKVLNWLKNVDKNEFLDPRE